MDLNKYNRIREYLISEGYTASEAYRMLKAGENPENFDNSRLAEEVYNGSSEIIKQACRKRCPDRPGYNENCEHCIVQYVMNLIFIDFKIKCKGGTIGKGRDIMKAFSALCWLLLDEHKPKHWCY